MNANHAYSFENSTNMASFLCIMKQACKTFLKEKIVGDRRVRTMTHASPVEFHRRALALQAHMERLNPFCRPRGFVFKAKTRDDYEAWKRQQTNPRLW